MQDSDRTICTKCGASVGDAPLHRDWHAANNESEWWIPKSVRDARKRDLWRASEIARGATDIEFAAKGGLIGPGEYFCAARWPGIDVFIDGMSPSNPRYMVHGDTLTLSIPEGMAQLRETRVALHDPATDARWPR